jgi:hypothetical protein
MLLRVYNLSMHTSLPIKGVPYRWVMFWSRQLEADLLERRLHEKVNRNRRRR